MNEDTENLIREKRAAVVDGMPSTRAFKRDDLTYRIIGAALEVHSELGPGLVEKVYENALCLEFRRRGIQFERQKRFRVKYLGEDVGDLVADLVVESQAIVELKAVSELLPVHEAQVISYLKASSLRRGLLINFNVTRLKSGIRRISV